MKYAVARQFADKMSKKIYHHGSTYETTSKKRADELQKAGYLAGTPPAAKAGDK
jgi:hypothetical protein